MSAHPQLTKLSQPFPDAYVEKPPQGKYGSYVAHHVINQALLATVGPFDFETVQILRNYVPERTTTNKKTGEVKVWPAVESAVVGVVARLTVQIDGRTVRIEEAGDCEDPHNWATDGARLKDCLSDALKRCAMRLGLGLHLWAQEHFFLHASLTKREAENGKPDVERKEEPEAALPPSAPSPSVPPASRPVRDAGALIRNNKRIHALGAELGLSHEQISTDAKLVYQVESMKDLSPQQQEQIIADLEQQLNSPQEEYS